MKIATELPFGLRYLVFPWECHHSPKMQKESVSLYIIKAYWKCLREHTKIMHTRISRFIIQKKKEFQDSTRIVRTHWSVVTTFNEGDVAYKE